MFEPVDPADVVSIDAWINVALGHLQHLPPGDFWARVPDDVFMEIREVFSSPSWHLHLCALPVSSNLHP